MRTLAPLLLVLLTAGCIHLRPAGPFAKATSMEQYERAMWDAVQSGRWLDVQAHMAESYVAATPEGFRDRAAMLADWQKNKLTGFTLGDLQTRPNGADMVVTYTLTANGQRPMRVMTVWQSVKRGYIQIAQSFSPVP